MKTPIDFDALFASHHRKMISTVLRIVGSDDAEDVAQLAWRNAWKYREGFNGTAKPSTWLYQVASNTAISWLRSQKRYTRQDPIDDQALEIPDARPSPEAALLRSEARALIRSIVLTLPPKTQTAMLQVYVHGHRVTDVIVASGEPPSTTKSRLRRGRDAVIAGIGHRALVRATWQRKQAS